LLIQLIFAPSRVYSVIPQVKAQNLTSEATAPPPRVYTQAEIDEMTAHTFHPYILRKLIACESQDTDVARMDSNHQMSYGILQFNGTSTWAEFAPLANVSGSPMNPADAIKVADYMISIRELHRWACAYITGLL
jgi:hypothetical protein